MALEFDGATQYVDISGNAGITGGAITLPIWVKLNNEIGAGRWCFILQRESTNNTKYAIYYDYNSGTRRLNYQRTRFGVADVNSYYTVTLGTSNWYHIVLTYDNSKVRGYLNGALVAGPTSTTGNGTPGGADYIVIGAESSGIRFSDATLFDSRIYNHALTINEITEIYHKKGADRVWEGLVGQWRMDEKTSEQTASGASSIIDSSGNGNHGTPGNSPIYRDSPHRLRRGVLMS